MKKSFQLQVYLKKSQIYSALSAPIKSRFPYSEQLKHLILIFPRSSLENLFSDSFVKYMKSISDNTTKWNDSSLVVFHNTQHAI